MPATFSEHFQVGEGVFFIAGGRSTVSPIPRQSNIHVTAWRSVRFALTTRHDITWPSLALIIVHDIKPSGLGNPLRCCHGWVMCRKATCRSIPLGLLSPGLSCSSFRQGCELLRQLFLDLCQGNSCLDGMLGELVLVASLSQGRDAPNSARRVPVVLV